MDKSTTTLNKLTLEFEAHNTAERKSEETVIWYDHSLELLGDYLEEEGLSTTLGDLTVEVVRTYVLHLHKRHKYPAHPFVSEQDAPLSKITVNNHVRALKAF